jgi:2-oxoglutarate ferredoxin oxidoreductase subunit alpha
MGIPVGVLQPLVLWPFPHEALRTLAQRIRTFIVPEMNLGQVAHEVSCATWRTVVQVNRVDGTLISPDEILEAITHVSV